MSKTPGGPGLHTVSARSAENGRTLGTIANAQRRIPARVSARGGQATNHLRTKKGVRMHRTKKLGLLMLFLIASPFALLAQQQRPIVIWENKHDVSPPLRSMPIYHGGKGHREMEPWRKLPMPAATQPSGTMSTQTSGQASGDAALQSQTVTPFAATTGLSFEGLGNGQYGFSVNSAPPDTNGAIGTTQYVQMVNSSYAVFSKSTGALVAGPFASNSLWSGWRR